MLDFNRQTSSHVICDGEILEGMNEIGALIVGHDYKTWWAGSRLTVATAKSLVPGYNPAIVHKAAGLISSLHWVLQHPSQGLLYPESLPHEEIISTIRDYLDLVVSSPAHWDPLTTKHCFSLWDYGTMFGRDDFPKEAEMWQYPVSRTGQISLEDV